MQVFICSTDKEVACLKMKSENVNHRVSLSLEQESKILDITYASWHPYGGGNSLIFEKHLAIWKMHQSAF